MPISVVTVATATAGNGTSFTALTTPTNRVAGDLLVAIVGVDGAPTVTPSSGWQQLNLGSYDLDGSLFMFARVANGNATADNLNLTYSALESTASAMYVIRDHEVTDISQITYTSLKGIVASSGSSGPLPASPTGRVDRDLILMGMTFHSGTYNPTHPLMSYLASGSLTSSGSILHGSLKMPSSPYQPADFSVSGSGSKEYTVGVFVVPGIPTSTAYPATSTTSAVSDYAGVVATKRTSASATSAAASDGASAATKRTSAASSSSAMSASSSAPAKSTAATSSSASTSDQSSSISATYQVSSRTDAVSTVSASAISGRFSLNSRTEAVSDGSSSVSKVTAASSSSDSASGGSAAVTKRTSAASVTTATSDMSAAVTKAAFATSRSDAVSDAITSAAATLSAVSVTSAVADGLSSPTKLTGVTSATAAVGATTGSVTKRTRPTSTSASVSAQTSSPAKQTMASSSSGAVAGTTGTVGMSQVVSSTTDAASDQYAAPTSTPPTTSTTDANSGGSAEITKTAQLVSRTDALSDGSAAPVKRTSASSSSSSSSASSASPTARRVVSSRTDAISDGSANPFRSWSATSRTDAVSSYTSESNATVGLTSRTDAVASTSGVVTKNALVGEQRRQLRLVSGPISSSSAGVWAIRSDSAGPTGQMVSRLTSGAGPYSWGMYTAAQLEGWDAVAVPSGAKVRIELWARASAEASFTFDFVNGGATDRPWMGSAPGRIIGTDWTKVTFTVTLSKDWPVSSLYKVRTSGRSVDGSWIELSDVDAYVTVDDSIAPAASDTPAPNTRLSAQATGRTDVVAATSGAITRNTWGIAVTPVLSDYATQSPAARLVASSRTDAQSQFTPISTASYPVTSRTDTVASLIANPSKRTGAASVSAAVSAQSAAVAIRGQLSSVSASASASTSNPTKRTPVSGRTDAVSAQISAISRRQLALSTTGASSDSMIAPTRQTSASVWTAAVSLSYAVATVRMQLRSLTPAFSDYYTDEIILQMLLSSRTESFGGMVADAILEPIPAIHRPAVMRLLTKVSSQLRELNQEVGLLAVTESVGLREHGDPRIGVNDLNQKVGLREVST